MMSTRAAQASVRASAHQFFSVPRTAAMNGLRTYAAPAGQAQSAQDSRPPVALFGIDGTYANALYTAAAKSSALEPTSKALTTLSEVFKRDPKLPSLLNAPTLTAADKSEIIKELQKVMGPGAEKSEILKNFLQTLAANNRLSVLGGVCEKFEVLMGAYHGEIELNITSAQKLDTKTLQRLETAVAKSEYSQGKKLKLVTKVDPEVIGGLIVEIGDRTIDLSVSSKMHKLNKLLTDTL